MGAGFLILFIFTAAFYYCAKRLVEKKRWLLGTCAPHDIEENDMWYFTWILGVLLACAFGIINALWLESQSSGNDESGNS